MIRSIKNYELIMKNGRIRFLSFLILNFSFFIAAPAARSAPEGVARFERTFADAARAYDENRLAEAIAQEQEMKALVANNRASLVLAEAQVPQAMAEAFRAGRISDAATISQN